MILRSRSGAATLSHSYTYDLNGNVTAVKRNSKTVEYIYDKANRLVRENNPFLNKTYTYAYDDNGNITSKKEYSYTTTTNPSTPKTYNYTYNSNGLLTQFGGSSISYHTGIPVEGIQVSQVIPMINWMRNLKRQLKMEILN